MDEPACKHLLWRADTLRLRGTGGSNPRKHGRSYHFRPDRVALGAQMQAIQTEELAAGATVGPKHRSGDVEVAEARVFFGERGDPLVGIHLNHDEINLIYSWIVQGAENN